MRDAKDRSVVDSSSSLDDTHPSTAAGMDDGMTRQQQPYFEQGKANKEEEEEVEDTDVMTMDHPQAELLRRICDNEGLLHDESESGHEAQDQDVQQQRQHQVTLRQQELKMELMEEQGRMLREHYENSKNTNENTTNENTTTTAITTTTTKNSENRKKQDTEKSPLLNVASLPSNHQEDQEDDDKDSPDSLPSAESFQKQALAAISSKEDSNGKSTTEENVPCPTRLSTNAALRNATLQRPGAFPVEGPGGSTANNNSGVEELLEEDNGQTQQQGVGIAIGIMTTSTCSSSCHRPDNNTSMVEDSMDPNTPIANPVSTALTEESSGRLRSMDLGLPYVEEEEERNERNKIRRRTKTWQQYCLGLGLVWIFLVVLVVVVIVLVVVLPRQESSLAAIEEDATTQEEPAPYSLEDVIQRYLPLETLEAIWDDPYSPQALAYEWTLQDAPAFLNNTHHTMSTTTTTNTATATAISDDRTDGTTTTTSLPLLLSPHERILQRFALATMFYATDGPSQWRNTTRWLDHDQHECTWFTQRYFEDVEMYMNGATAHTFVEMYGSRTYPCTYSQYGGYVEHLWLWKNDLRGTLPMRELTLLTHLKSLALFGNPELDVGPLTSSELLGQLTQLEGLEISGMQAVGSLPTEIGLLTHMKCLLASYNRIGSSIPSEFGLLTDLEYAMISENELTGTLPDELSNLSSLMWFYVYKNHNMTGTIPTVLGQLTTLELLNMYTNQFSGTLPSELGLLTRMDLLAVSDNRLDGPIPSELGQLTNLKQGLSLHQNQFTGTIPTEFGNFRNLTGVITGSGTYGLGLSDNWLQGPIPSELGHLVVLERLFLHNNPQLAGPLPSELGRMTGLVNITLGGDFQLSGTIPESLCPVVNELTECGLLCGCNCTCGR